MSSLEYLVYLLKRLINILVGLAMIIGCGVLGLPEIMTFMWPVYESMDFTPYAANQVLQLILVAWGIASIYSGLRGKSN